MICVAASYMAGKAMSPEGFARPVRRCGRGERTGASTHRAESGACPVPEAPLFAEPKAGSVYIQMGAVEKGVSVIFAEGLRKRGLPAFVAPGPSEKIFRVLIGPLAGSGRRT